VLYLFLEYLNFAILFFTTNLNMEANSSLFSKEFSKSDAQMSHKNFRVFSVLGSSLRLKAEADSSSRRQKYFICREEKRKAAQWSHGSGWKMGFIAFFLLPEGGDVSQEQIDVSWEEVSLWPILSFWDLLQSVLQVSPLNDHPNCCQG
jgi:hypothetical protein